MVEQMVANMSDPRQEAQVEAERTMDGFIRFTKWTVYASIAFLLIVGACDFGNETGPNKTGSQYDGSVYDPQNLNGCKNFKCP